MDISDKVRQRYRKVRDRADKGSEGGEQAAARKVLGKLESANPGIREAIHREDQVEKIREAVRKAAGGHDPIGKEAWDNATKAVNGMTPDEASAWRRFGWKALGWAAHNLGPIIEHEMKDRKMKPAMQENTEESLYPDVNRDDDDTIEEPTDAELVLAALENEEIVIELGDDDDSGEELLTMEMVIPVDLFAKLREHPDVLYAFIQTLIDEAE